MKIGDSRVDFVGGSWVPVSLGRDRHERGKSTSTDTRPSRRTGQERKQGKRNGVEINIVTQREDRTRRATCSGGEERDEKCHRGGCVEGE